jgi:osomolarity two-component system sensor histidine kinase NIK1
MFNLKRLNLEITTASNGYDAIDKIKTDTFDLVLMDIILPGKNGFEITGEIREFERNSDVKIPVPIVALTANTLDNDREKCIAAGMNDYLSKPFTAEQLIEKVKQFI